MKITDGQVRRLRRLLDAEEFLVVAARRTGMDEKTARKYRDLEGFRFVHPSPSSPSVVACRALCGSWEVCLASIAATA